MASGDVVEPLVGAIGAPIGIETVVEKVAALDSADVATGRLAGRVEVLLWMQNEIQVSLREWDARDKFADLRALNELLALVQDSLAGVQDGSGTWAGLIRRDLVVPSTGPGEGIVPPGAEMGN